VLHPWHFLSLAITGAGTAAMDGATNNVAINAIARKGALAELPR
jgi:hypothetical protein